MQKNHGYRRRFVSCYGTILILLFSAPQQWAYCTSYKKKSNTDMSESSLYSVGYAGTVPKTLIYPYCWLKIWVLFSVGIRDILVRIRIPGSVPLTNGSDFFLHGFKRCKKNIFSPYFFLLLLKGHKHHLQSKKFNFLLKLWVKILFCRHYFSPLNTSMRKGKDPDPDPYYLRLMDPEPGGQKHADPDPVPDPET